MSRKTTGSRKAFVMIFSAFCVGLTLAFVGTKTTADDVVPDSRGAMSVAANGAGASVKPIIHDAEYYVLETQHGEKWAKQNKDINTKLAEIRAKNGGRRPNIIHIMGLLPNS